MVIFGAIFWMLDLDTTFQSCFNSASFVPEYLRSCFCMMSIQKNWTIFSCWSILLWLLGHILRNYLNFSTQNSLSENSLRFGYANLHCIIDVSDDSIAVSPIGSHERYQSGLWPDARNFANSFTYWICLWFSLLFIEPTWTLKWTVLSSRNL